MRGTHALPLVLEVLDDGLRLYRRHLASFTSVATAVLIVVALLATSFMAFVRAELGEGWSMLAFAIVLLSGYPLVLYTFAALSRATASALDGQPITVPGSLRLNPMRGCGMVLFNVLFATITSICSSIFSIVIICPMMYISLLSSGLFASFGDDNTTIAGVAFGLIFSQIGTLWSIIMAGAWVASVVYALQAFVLEQRSWTGTAGRAFDLVFTHFGRSLLMFSGAGAIFGTLIVSYLGSLLVLIGTLESRFGLTLPPLAGDIVTIVLTVGSLVVLLPPLAIWMAIYHRRMARERDGHEIVQRVATWRSQAGKQSM